MKTQIKVTRGLIEGYCSAPDGQYIATITDQRNHLQNSYFHVVVKFVKDVFRDCGNAYSFDAVKEWLKHTFMHSETVVIEGKIVVVSKHTSKLSKRAMQQLISDIGEWLMDEYGLQLPERDDDA